MAGYFRQKPDLAGQRYGCLTVLGPHKQFGSRTAWRCLCDCGKEIVVTTRRLQSEHTKSCGCLHERRYSDLSARFEDAAAARKRAYEDMLAPFSERIGAGSPKDGGELIPSTLCVYGHDNDLG